jgi:methionyl-tRNA formyltransferase
MGASSFSCWLIGADSLLEECGEILLRGGHDVRGVVTGAERLQAWAERRGLAVLDPSGDYASELAQRPFDHLFAITHLARLPDPVLSLPARGAINFHDGPLPSYAGLNVPAWALLQGETRHGITWHFMTSDIDGGPVLKQRTFDLAPDETSFSLNAKCFEAAIDSFGELVSELASGTIRPLPQELGQRRLYERHQRPPAACAIDWTRPAREIEALVRALDYGRYRNPLGAAKMQRGGRALIVARASASPNESRAGSSPGSVLACDAHEVWVATGSGAISLRGFADLRGRELDPAQAVRALELAPGVALDVLDPERVERLTQLDRRMSRAERFWVKRLADLDPITIPVPPSRLARPHALEVAVPPRLAQRYPHHPQALVLTAAFSAYLARIGRRSTFDLGYADAALRGEAAGEPAVSPWLPLRV